MTWKCQNCGKEHPGTRTTCKRCNSRDVEYKKQSVESISVSSNQTVDATPEADFDKSPDVAVDGSLDDEQSESESTAVPSHVDQPTERNVGALRSTAFSIRAWIKAPFKIVLMYLPAILAFLFVFGLLLLFLL